MSEQGSSGGLDFGSLLPLAAGVAVGLRSGPEATGAINSLFQMQRYDEQQGQSRAERKAIADALGGDPALSPSTQISLAEYRAKLEEAQRRLAEQGRQRGVMGKLSPLYAQIPSTQNPNDILSTLGTVAPEADFPAGQAEVNALRGALTAEIPKIAEADTLRAALGRNVDYTNLRPEDVPASGPLPGLGALPPGYEQFIKHTRATGKVSPETGMALGVPAGSIPGGAKAAAEQTKSLLIPLAASGNPEALNALDRIDPGARLTRNYVASRAAAGDPVMLKTWELLSPEGRSITQGEMAMIAASPGHPQQAQAAKALAILKQHDTQTPSLNPNDAQSMVADLSRVEMSLPPLFLHHRGLTPAQARTIRENVAAADPFKAAIGALIPRPPTAPAPLPNSGGRPPRQAEIDDIRSRSKGDRKVAEELARRMGIDLKKEVVP